MSSLEVLIVEDDKDFADSVAEMLELDEHQVTVLASGEEAVANYDEKGLDFASRPSFLARSPSSFTESTVERRSHPENRNQACNARTRTGVLPTIMLVSSRSRSRAPICRRRASRLRLPRPRAFPSIS